MTTATQRVSGSDRTVKVRDVIRELEKQFRTPRPASSSERLSARVEYVQSTGQHKVTTVVTPLSAKRTPVLTLQAKNPKQLLRRIREGAHVHNIIIRDLGGLERLEKNGTKS